MIGRRSQLILQLLIVAGAATVVALFPGAVTPTTTVLLLLAVVAAMAVHRRPGRGDGRAEQTADTRPRGAATDARRLKIELLSNVSHELRTPLNAILGYAEILESIPEIAVAERQQMVSRILSNAMTLTCAVNNLLEYSSVVAGAGELRSGTVRLRSVGSPTRTCRCSRPTARSSVRWC